MKKKMKQSARSSSWIALPQWAGQRLPPIIRKSAIAMGRPSTCAGPELIELTARVREVLIADLIALGVDHTLQFCELSYEPA